MFLVLEFSGFFFSQEVTMNLTGSRQMPFVMGIATATVAAVFVISAGPAAANVLTNGDFEDTSGTFPTGWTTVNADVSQASGLAGSTTSAEVTRSFSTNNAWLGQGGELPGDDNNFRFQIDFAYEADPDRPFNVTLREASDPTISGTAVVNARVNGSNGLDMVDSTGGISWENVTTGLSASDYSANQVNAYRLTISGSLHDATMTTSLEDLSSGTMLADEIDTSGFWQADPTNSTELSQVLIEVGRSANGGLVRADNVSLAVPEPASAAVLAMGSLVAFRRRRQ
jgi:hypothetical protein